MRRIVSLLLIVCVVACLGSRVTAAEPKKDKKARAKLVKLFNGKDLEGWSCFTIDKEAKTEDIWSVKDGVLVCKGEPLGYLHTKKEFTNYKLVVVWRWAPGGEPGNNGILLRIQGKPVSFLPKCAECQLKSGSAGDIYGFYGYSVSGPEDRYKVIESPQLGKIHAVSKAKAAEKEPGKWNKAEVTVDGGTITVVINGEEVNQATKCDVAAGTIGLQSEGGEIHFRRVVLFPIKK